ncbi:hypothetical protein, variant [Aphanomyces invadans]|uniref:EF-hand domain-containing protein n=1 Tax=Aphanomyces invadans TaxID=157072 RepID=A0A024U2E6_9STRA|nr:hypothetical protein, variant [Aphanomyces invadans]ETW00072.1 hypothetical protein, variant [Aphanomyces invadans]|eukprot:XP_008871097.1 hypothetical protein, variant [Aphanomyces invadans]
MGTTSSTSTSSTQLSSVSLATRSRTCNRRTFFECFAPRRGKSLIMGHWCQVAKRMKDQEYISSTSRPPSNQPTGGDTPLSTLDNNSNIRRGLDLAAKRYDKLNAICLKMDVGCTGCLSKEEFELAMTHVGVNLNTQEYERLYVQLPATVRHAPSDGIFYTGFLAMLGVKMTHLFQNQKLWELMLQHGDVLRKYLTHCQKQGKDAMSPDHFRDLLGHCGITLSNGDFTGLRMRMQEFQDVDGNINLTDFLAALNDKASFLANSTGLVGCTGPASPHRRGKKIVDTHEMCVSAAGKSTEQRNSEAQMCRGKTTDVAKKPTFSNLYMQNVANSPGATPAASGVPSLEERILSKMHTFQAMGYTHCATFKSIFPGDRFGKITRGHFRQSLAQLHMVSRHAEVEALFWKLDPAGRGYIGAHELHSHLQKRQDCSSDSAVAGTSTVSLQEKATEGTEVGQSTTQRHPPLRLDEKKVFDALYEKIPDVVRACQAVDSGKTGAISRGDFVWALQQGGVILSQADASHVVAALSSRKDGVVMYDQITDTIATLLQLPGTKDSTKSSRQHLSNTSVLLDQDSSVVESTRPPEAVKKVQDYPARRSSLQLGYGYDDPSAQEMSERNLTSNLHSNASLYHHVPEPEKLERALRQRHARRVLLIQNILERRSDLKMCFDMMPYRQTPRGLVLLTVDEIADILSCARMNIHFKTPDEAKTLLREIVPPNLDKLSFVELIRVLTMAQRMEPAPDEDWPPLVASPCRGQDALSPACCEVSIRAKLLQFSTLKDVSVMQWNTTGAIIVRHAFKGLSRDTVATSSSGSTFDALCRNVDLKHICTRLALDLTQTELHFLVTKIDVGKQGFFSSTALFQAFTQLLYAL